MKTLLTLNLCDFTIPLIQKKLKGLDGYYDMKKQKIFINTKMTLPMAQLTAVHEPLHAILHLGNESLVDALKDMKDTTKMEELMVVAFAAPLLALIRNNPEWIEFLTSE